MSEENTPEEAQLEAALEADEAAQAQPESKEELQEPEKPRRASRAKQKADRARHEEALAQAPAPPEPTEEQKAAQAAREELEAKMIGLQGEIDEAQALIAERKAKIQEILVQLYPSAGESDRPVDAIRGYLKAQAAERQNRPMNQERLKGLLQAAGKAPIDAAFHRARARGMARPTRSPMAQAPAAASDQAQDATPSQE